LKFSDTNAGFSFVELMIVVALITILAAIGIPKYQVFVQKAQTAEAKSHISAIYAAQTSFIAEFDKCSSNLKEIGFSAHGRLRYNAGFVSDIYYITPFAFTFSGGTQSRLSQICGGLGAGTDTSCEFIETPTEIVSLTGQQFYCNLNDHSYRAVATRAIHGDGTNVIAIIMAYYFPDWATVSIDAWTIDQNKQVTNLRF
jgi:prepilin-type N-terminal cleavage/methylation domain-containing protein